MSDMGGAAPKIGLVRIGLRRPIEPVELGIDVIRCNFLQIRPTLL